MRPLFRILFILTILLSVQLPFTAEAAQGPLAVTVSIPPLKYFVEQIGGGNVDVTVMAAKGQDPHTYEPTASQMKGISGSELYFAIGVPFETQWLPKFRSMNPSLRVISLDVVDRIKGKPDLALRDTLPGKGRQQHNHGHYHHSLETDDPHVWMSPMNMRHAIPVIAEALGEKRPDLKESFSKRAEALQGDIVGLEAHIRELFAPLSRRTFLTFHQSWAYYAHDFTLREVSVELDGRQPGPKSMAMLMHFAKDNNITVIVADVMTSRSAVDAIARNINATVVIASPLEENWPDALMDFSQKLAAAMQGKK